jgi:hypothetical protein
VVQSSDWYDLELRGRAGFDYRAREDLDPLFSFDGAADLVFAMRFGEYQARVTAGIESRLSDNRDLADRNTNFVDFKASVEVPFSEAMGLGIAISKTLWQPKIEDDADERGIILSLDLSWELLNLLQLPEVPAT